MAEVPGTLEGWNVLHDFRTLDWARWKQLSQNNRYEAVNEAASVFDHFSESFEPRNGSSAFYSVVGHKADFLMLHLRPSTEELGALERAFNRIRLADFTSRCYSYLSVTELSLYEAYARGGTEDREQLALSPFVQKRLYPQIPDTKYICFYPMNKRRGETVNWYTETMDERRRMMREHGSTGRKYHGQVTQMITGSMGLDDWEWGVTLFSNETLPIKKLVYEMRFDEVSAKYADFGQFYIGTRFSPSELSSLLGDK